MYDFDKIVDRKHTYSMKWDGPELRMNKTGLLPLWVADMDWETPSFIKDAIINQINSTPVLGYTLDPNGWWETTIKWIKDHHQWDVKREWITYIPGIVKGIGMVINVFLKADEKVIVQPPIYHPFYLTPQGNDREVVWNPLIEVWTKDNGERTIKGDPEGHLTTYEMDFDNLAQVCDEKCRLLILANPHNPCGITWDKGTLQKLAHFAKEHNLIVISDEIHCDMAIFGNKHIPFATVSDEAAEVSITFSAPSKTFNIAGVVSSWVVVPNDTMRQKFFHWLEASELNEATMFSPIATMAAFQHGEPWRQEMLAYLEDNIDFVINYCKEKMPKIRPVRPQASYLVWLDCRGLGISHSELIDLFEHKAHLLLNEGSMFGKEGEGFMRLNVGCPRATLRQALDQLLEAINS